MLDLSSKGLNLTSLPLIQILQNLQLKGTLTLSLKVQHSHRRLVDLADSSEQFRLKDSL